MMFWPLQLLGALLLAPDMIWPGHALAPGGLMGRQGAAYLLVGFDGVFGLLLLILVAQSGYLSAQPYVVISLAQYGVMLTGLIGLVASYRLREQPMGQALHRLGVACVLLAAVGTVVRQWL